MWYKKLAQTEKEPWEMTPEELQKYKSVEEFIKAHPLAYHGTPDMRFLEEFDPQKDGYYKDAPDILPDNGVST